MTYRRKTGPKCCEQFIIFLIQKNEKKVFIDVTSSKEPSAVLRRHWRGDDNDTKLVFSKHNLKAEPIMWMWDAGYLPRRKAKFFVMEWERLFIAGGYEIIGSKISYNFRQNPPKLSGMELFGFRKASVSGLLNGEIGWVIECSAEGEGRRSPYQKFTAEATEQTLRVPVKAETAKNYKSFCKKEGLSYGQGLELLLADYTGNHDVVIRDLQERLIKADRLVEESKQKILELRETIKQLEEDRNYPKKYRTAELQKLLLEDFFYHLPPMKQQSRKMLKQYYYSEGVLTFPQGYDYSFPQEEGNIHIRLEHIRISKSDSYCMFIYGKDNAGNKIKIRWYPVKGNKFGVSLLKSPFLWENAPWIFSAQKEGDAMEMVGCLPNLKEMVGTLDEQIENAQKEIAECVEMEAEDDNLRTLLSKELYEEYRGWIKEAEELDQLYGSIGCKKRKTTSLEENTRNVLLDESSSLDEKIRAAQRKK